MKAQRLVRPPHAGRRLTVFGAGVGTFALFQIASRAPWITERLYAPAGTFFGSGLSRITGAVPFSLIEVAVVSYAVWRLALVLRATSVVVRKRRDWGNLLSCGVTLLARDVGIVLVLFYFLWGFHYARPPLPERLGWAEWAAPEVTELRRLAEEALLSANSAYVEIHGSEDAGYPTPLPADLDSLDRSLELGFARAGETLGLPPTEGGARGQAKPVFLSALVSRLGISGFYSPWTGEANVLGDLPTLGRVQSIAHEKAHQRGIAAESEASFLGYLGGTLATDPLARYGAHVYAWQRLQLALFQIDSSAVTELSSRVVPGIQRDQSDLHAYWRPKRGAPSRLGSAINDRFLRANRVPGGIANYGQSVRHLIQFSREQDRAQNSDRRKPSLP